MGDSNEWMSSPIIKHKDRYSSSLELTGGYRSKIDDGNEPSGQVFGARFGFVDFFDDEEDGKSVYPSLHYKIGYFNVKDFYRLDFTPIFQLNVPYFIFGAGGGIEVRNDSDHRFDLSPGVAALVSAGIYQNILSVEERISYHPIAENMLMYETLVNIDLVPLFIPLGEWMLSSSPLE